MVFVLLIVGMLLLMKGADFFVDGSASVARKLKVPSVIIGLTIVALGTSLPEASVSITAGLMGSNEIAISNIVGSNIFNTLVVVGTSALITPFIMDKEILSRDLMINIIVSVVLSIFVLNGMLNRFEGIALLVGLVFYIYILIQSAKSNRTEADEEQEILSTPKCLIYIVIGVACIIYGGDITVDSAKQIAAMLGMSDTLIGLTVVSIGTSLPELVTSVVAARKGESGLSLGNAIGSNIMNILFILGASSTLHPISATTQNITDAFMLIGVALFIFLMARRSDKMTRQRGLLMIGVYLIYTIYICMR
jgi:cation:H+ antiporter